MTDEQQRATALQEIAKASGKAIDAASALGKFFCQIFGPGLAHLGGAFSDWAYVFRYENALKLSEKVEKIHEARGISGKTTPIAPRLAIPLIRKATEEDDEMLQSMWAGLIANATDPAKHTEARRTYVDLLGSLEPLDALVLQAIYQDELVNPHRHRRLWLSPEQPERKDGRCPGKRNVQWLSKRLEVPATELALSVETLWRLGLIQDDFPEKPELEHRGAPLLVPVTHSEAELGLTHTGRALLTASIAPELPATSIE